MWASSATTAGFGAPGRNRSRRSTSAVDGSSAVSVAVRRPPVRNSADSPVTSPAAISLTVRSRSARSSPSDTDARRRPATRKNARSAGSPSRASTAPAAISTGGAARSSASMSASASARRPHPTGPRAAIGGGRRRRDPRSWRPHSTKLCRRQIDRGRGRGIPFIRSMWASRDRNGRVVEGVRGGGRRAQARHAGRRRRTAGPERRRADLRRHFRATIVIMTRRVRRRGAGRGPQAAAARRPGGAVPGRPAHAGHDRDRVPDARRARSTRTRSRCCSPPTPTPRRRSQRSTRSALDHYLMKPWDPPEQKLYPVLDDLLADWSRDVRAAYDGIRVVGTPGRREPRGQGLPGAQPGALPVARHRPRGRGARACSRACRADARSCRWCSSPTAPAVGAHPPRAGREGRAATRAAADVLRPGRDRRRAGRAGGRGLRRVGGAPDGARRAEAPGGQAGTSSRIENYLGFPAVSGADLARARGRAGRRFGAEILSRRRCEIAARDPYRKVVLADGTELALRAPDRDGRSVRRSIAGHRAAHGAGVYYGAALTEAAHYRDQDVIVVGGANSAGQGAMFFSRYARKVTMLVRGRVSGEVDVAVPRRPDRGDAEHRGA